MKAEELMIGDLLLYQDGERLILVSVGKFDLDAVRVKRKDGHVFNVGIELLQPVPVIPMFLEKIGFKKKSDAWIFELEYQDYILVQFDVDNITVQQIEISVVDEAYFRAKNIKYIHQLQHALRLCKIDKLPI